MHSFTNKHGSILRKISSTPPTERVYFHLGEEGVVILDDEEKEHHHDVFCELAELDVSNGPEWRETARWIKFEEDVEEGGERWSKPHVATLSLHSLFELRCCLLNPACIVLLNFDALTIEQIAARLVEEYCTLDPSVSHELREHIRETVIQRHSHLYMRKKESGVLLRSLAEIGKKLSTSARDIEKDGDDDANYGIGALLHPGGPGMLGLGMGNLGAFAIGVSGVTPPVGALSIPGGHEPHATARSRAMQRAGSGREHVSLPGHSPRPGDSNSALPFSQRSGNWANGPRSPEELYPDGKRSTALGSSHNIRTVDSRRSRSGSRDSVNSSGNQSSSVNRSQNSIAREPTIRKISTQTSIDDEPGSAVKFDAHFMKKIPPGAEAANILVGEAEWLDKSFVAFVRLNKAVLLGDLTEVPVPTRFVFILLGPPSTNQRYHEIGRSMATLMSDEIFHDVAYKARTREDLLVGLDEFLSSVTVLPPGEWDPSIRIEPPENLSSETRNRKLGVSAPKEANGDTSASNGPTTCKTDAEEKQKQIASTDESEADQPLIRTGRLFGGLRNDIRRRRKWFLSDFTDALHVQCVAAFVFLYFACLAPTITFGGMLDFELDGHMATLESIISAALCGIVYALTAGQPLTILGSTGPVLIFEVTLYTFSQKMAIDFMTFRLWVGLWTSVLLLVIVALDLSALVQYITRFTEEGFSCLISLIFIVEAFAKLSKIAHDNPVVHNAGELYAIGTRTLRCACVLNSQYLPNDTCSNVTDVQRRYYVTKQPDGISTCFANSSTLALSVAECKEREGTLRGPDCDVPDYLPEVFYFSCILFSGTFIISYGLKCFKSSSYFSSLTRELVSDFAVVIAIVSMSFVDAFVGLSTPKLTVPSSFKPTRNDRGWLIPIYTDKTPVWSIFAAVVPAILAAILIFMDQHISAVIVNRKENKLCKGVGYHLDLMIVTVLIAMSSFLGIPWFVASTVPSINHVMALRKESKCNAPGEKPKYLGCRENRVTGLAIGIMTLFSVFLAGVLKRIPMAVLYGVFLFMGISSLEGVQLITRVSIMFQPQKLQPDEIWLRNVPLRRVHLFTVIQLLALVAMWTVKAIHATSIAFPLLVGALCFIRKLLDKVFTQHELMYLDDIIKSGSKQDEELSHRKTSMEPLHRGEAEKFVLDDGKVLSIRIDEPAPKETPQIERFDLSEHVSKTNIWQQLMNDTKLNALPPQSAATNSNTVAAQLSTPERHLPSSANSSKRSSFSEERKRFLDSPLHAVQADVDESHWQRYKKRVSLIGEMNTNDELADNQLGKHKPSLPSTDSDAPNIVVYPSTPDRNSAVGTDP